MTFTEANTVEQMILDSVAPKHGDEPFKAHEDTHRWDGSLGGEFRPVPFQVTAESTHLSPKTAATRYVDFYQPIKALDPIRKASAQFYPYSPRPFSINTIPVGRFAIMQAEKYSRGYRVGVLNHFDEINLCRWPLWPPACLNLCLG